ncbi:MAG: hypothetical protein MUC69_01490, partial [Gemmatimonadales bacterium]|nr:hypothetical protein [Gemmatimonadales bacterium]
MPLTTHPRQLSRQPRRPRRTAAAMALAVLAGHAAVAQAQARTPAAPPASVTVFRGVRIFDGRSSALKGPADVLVRGNVIERISMTPLTGGAVAGATVIDGKGR